MRDNKVWGEQLRTWRQSVARSQAAFADALSKNIGNLGVADEQQLKMLGMLEQDGLTSSMLSKYEVGQRVPEARGRHLLLLWGLTRAGCPLAPSDANTWLILGGQGLLAAHEMKLIFGNSTPLYALLVTPARDAALDDLLEQLLQLLRRLNAREGEASGWT